MPSLFIVMLKRETMKQKYETHENISNILNNVFT